MSRNVSRAYQLTIRVTGPIAEAVRETAKSEDISLNQAVIRLLEKGAGLDRREGSRIGSRLRRFSGLLSKEEADSISAAAKEAFRHVDPEFWK